MAEVKLSLCFLLLSVCCLSLLPCGLSSEHGTKRVLVGGDVNLGGLFPIHEPGPDGKCGHVSPAGIQALEAMLFAIDTVNRDPVLLPSVTLGSHILDTCKDPQRAVRAAMTFVHPGTGAEDAVCADGSRPHLRHLHKQPVCVIGTGGQPGPDVIIAQLLGLLKVPQISYTPARSRLTSPEFEYFFRVAPSETAQAVVLADIVGSLGWNYVSLVVKEGMYYEQNAEVFQAEAKKRGICIATLLKIARDSDVNSMDEVIQRLLSTPRAIGVVVFSTTKDAARLFAAAERMGAKGHFVWLGGESWHRKNIPTSGHGESVITIGQPSVRLGDFADYFSKLRPHTNRRNPWFRQYWDQHIQRVSESMSEGGAGEPCPTSDEEGVGLSHHAWVPGVIDAVTAVATALHNMQQSVCPPRTRHRLCPEMKHVDAELLLKYIANVTFTGSGQEEVSFDSARKVPARYQVLSLHGNGTAHFNPVGQWDGFSSSPLQLNPGEIQWPRRPASSTDTDAAVSPKDDIPKSVCSDPCSEGQKKVSMSGESCCWVCVQCGQGEYLKDDVTCEACPAGQLANDSHAGCEPTNQGEEVDGAE